MTPDVDPLDTFKRAMTATMRAIAENEEMEVSFGKGGTSVQGNNVRVPQPNYGCSDTELNAVRGVGDEIALKMRYHDSLGSSSIHTFSRTRSRALRVGRGCTRGIHRDFAHGRRRTEP